MLTPQGGWDLGPDPRCAPGRPPPPPPAPTGPPPSSVTRPHPHPTLGLRPRSPALTEVTASQISAAQTPGDGAGGLRQGRLPGQLGALHGGGPASSAWDTCWERTGWAGEMQPLCSRACGLQLWAWKGAGPGTTWPLCFWPSVASTGLGGSRCQVPRDKICKLQSLLRNPRCLFLPLPGPPQHSWNLNVSN